MAGGKFKKPKRGGGHRFTSTRNRGDDAEGSWDIPPESIASDASSGSESGSESDSDAQPKFAPKSKDSDEVIYEGNPIREFGKVVIEDEEEEKPAPDFKPMNPNKVAAKNLKASELSTSDNVPMSRREREAIEKERAKAAYWKLQEAGKTDQAKADLARLALIKKEREEAARKRAEIHVAKAASSTKTASLTAGKGIIGKTVGSSKK
ncbi:heat- and acid-stable phosphoprotein [Chytridiales sp. JEL 0842]|nr:heat- and acid-stable phosphoprotein [Chytridiales sp. JEL 0842]